MRHALLLTGLLLSLGLAACQSGPDPDKNGHVVSPQAKPEDATLLKRYDLAGTVGEFSGKYVVEAIAHTETGSVELRIDQTAASLSVVAEFGGSSRSISTGLL